MPTLDVFNNDAFGTIQLTEAINVVPNYFGRVGELNIFKPKSVTTTTVAIEINNGVLNLLPPTQRGGPASVNKTGKRQVKSFAIPQFALEDTIQAADVQNVRAFGSETELQMVQDVVNERLAELSLKHDITREWLRVGALHGVVQDDAGSTILDLFTEFGVVQKEVDFVLGTGTTDVPAKCREVVRHMELNLKGDTMRGVHCLASMQFMDKLLAHTTVRDAYIYQQGTSLLRDDVRKNFTFHGITFEEYLGSATDKDGNVRKFIPDGDARFFPVGTNSSFVDYSAPADFMETVNTMGLPKYAKQAVDSQFQRFVQLHTQMNPLPICMRPALLVRGYSSN